MSYLRRSCAIDCVKADSQTEMDSWIDAVHLSCAASYARHLGRDGSAKLLRAEIHKLENSIDLVCLHPPRRCDR